MFYLLQLVHAKWLPGQLSRTTRRRTRMLKVVLGIGHLNVNLTCDRSIVESESVIQKSRIDTFWLSKVACQA